MHLSLRLLSVIALTTGLAVSQDPSNGLQVRLFSPLGLAKNVQQVRAVFTQDILSFGDSQHPDPFEIDCQATGQGRWVSPVEWVYDFESPLPAGIRCRFSLLSGVRSAAGEPVAGPREFSFFTGGPSIAASIPWDGSRGIDEEQIFVLRLDGPVDPASVPDNVYFAVEGIGERIAARVVEGDERAEALAANPYFLETPEEASSPAILLLKASRRFPADVSVELVWGAGVRTLSGVETGQAQGLNFRTRPPFDATFFCQRENEEADCIPFLPMRIRFSSAVEAEVAGQVELLGADGRKFQVRIEADTNTVWGVEFPGPFPPLSEFTVRLPSPLRDDAGRNLANANRFPLKVKTADFPPLAKFAADFGILESETPPLVPLTIRNLEAELPINLLELRGELSARTLQLDTADPLEVMSWITRIRNRSWEDRSVSLLSGESSARSFTLPLPEQGKIFQVVGVPLPGPGFYVLEATSRVLGNSLLGEPRPLSVPTAALVTDLSLHFKWGHESSLVWVTHLQSAQPAAGVRLQVWDCQGERLWEGVTDTNGIARPENLPRREEASYCPDGAFSSGLLVTARKDDDFSFLHSDWNEGIEAWRFQVPVDWSGSAMAAHTVLDRPLFRAGETVHMKHFIRRRTVGGFGVITPQQLPEKMEIVHSGSGQRFAQDVHFDGTGAALSEWKIPAHAKLGSYDILLSSEADQSAGNWSSGSFRVEEFRLPLMRGVIRAPAERQVAPRSMPLDLSVSYLAGGGASGLEATLRYQFQAVAPPQFEDFKGFVFANGGIEPGSEDESEVDGETDQVFSRPLRLDDTGAARSVVDGIPERDRPFQVFTELEYPDPNGEIQTVAAGVPVYPFDRLVGIRKEGWILRQAALKFQVAVTDLDGGAVAGVPVAVTALERKVFSHRKRLVGGFYAYENRRDVLEHGEVCAGVTDPGGILACDVSSPVAGNVILRAEVADSTGRRSLATTEAWVVSEDRWWFGAEDHDRIDVIPERPRYEPGQTARLQVRVPFAESTALVTVEREGVLEAFVTPLSGNQPVVEIPVLPNYAPNVFVSVLTVRGRIADAVPTATLDLGKPAYKLGLAELEVGWQGHQLEVEVTPDKEVYQVRDTATVKIEVRTADGRPLGGDSEIALAAVDESLLELTPNLSWDLLDSMMGRRGYGIETSTAQMQVVGKRHFGLKALPQGGGGGQSRTRELFDTLLLWRGRVSLDASGRADVEVPLNDSLTSFRLVAIASSGLDRFGTGSATIRATQDLMLLPGIPPLVRQGDRFAAQFTVRNASDTPMTVDVKPEIVELPGVLTNRRVSLAAGQSEVLSWSVTVPEQATQLTYRLLAAASPAVRDQVQVVQRVIPVDAVQTVQATLVQLSQPWSILVERPRSALPGRGGVALALEPTLTAGLEGVRRYMREYPYGCLEQKVSQAVSTRNPDAWAKIAADLPAYQDANGLLTYFPGIGTGSEVLTSYVLSLINEAGWTFPEAEKERALTALRAFAEGRLRPPSIMGAANLTLRRLAVLETLSRFGRVDAELLTTLPGSPELWPTEALVDWFSVLLRLPPQTNTQTPLARVSELIGTRIRVGGTTLGFANEASERWGWMMRSGDSAAARFLLALLAAQDSADGGGVQNWVSEIPRVVRGLLGRQRSGRWDLTTANAWGTLAVEKFADRYESQAIRGATTARLQASTLTADWSNQPEGAELEFAWPSSMQELKVEHRGAGAPWLTLQSLAAIPRTESFSAGFRLEKEWIPVRQETPGRWTPGDVLRIRLTIHSSTDSGWVVVTDPVPAGVTILGSGLRGGSSLTPVPGGSEAARAWPSFEERAFDAYRAYFASLPEGEWVVEYAVRLNNPGDFRLPASRVEALYSPESFGELPNPTFKIEARP